MRYLFLIVTLLALTACQTSDSSLREQGRSEAYVMGFHDGRHSGMKEAGNYLEHFVRDHERFDTDADYQAGWLAGEAEGKRIQSQAQAVTDAASGSYTGYQVGKEVDKANHPEREAKKVLKGVDTDSLKGLEKK